MLCASTNTVCILYACSSQEDGFFGGARARAHTHASPLSTQVESADTQAAIARLRETPVELEEGEEEEVDDRPRWDRPSDRWGQTESGGGSDIP